METVTKDAEELQKSSKYKQMNKLKRTKKIKIKIKVLRSLKSHATNVQKATMFQVNAITRMQCAFFCHKKGHIEVACL